MKEIDFVDRLHDLREALHLIEMASQAIEATEDRGAIQRGIQFALVILASIEGDTLRSN